MTVVAINGSGRTGGNTAVLVQAVLNGAAEGGAETQLFELATWTLAGCDACRRCKQTRQCAIADDMARFYEIAPAADVLVVGSPIYLDHITGQLMSFIQRLFCYLGPPPTMENRWPNPRTRAVLAVTYGAGGAGQYDSVLDWMAGRMKSYWNIETAAKFKIPSTSHQPIVEAAHPEVRRAYEFGKTLGA